MRFAISIIAHNRLDVTSKCVESVLESSPSLDYHLILTDNASTDDTWAYFQSLSIGPNVCITRNETNQGFIRPSNNAFRIAKHLGAQFFVALNNDTIVPSGWLSALAEPLERYPRAALSGGHQGCCSLRDSFHGFKGKQVEYIEGSCLCARIDRIEEPFFSEYLTFAYGEDSDLSLRMREKGHTIHAVSMDVQHIGGATANLNPKLREQCRKSSESNHAILRKRWAHYLKVRRFDYPIILERDGAHGDVLLLTPIAKAIKTSNPLSPILVQTKLPSVLSGCPYVSIAVETVASLEAEMRINLNKSYESQPNTHIIKAYERAVMQHVAGMRDVELVTSINIALTARSWAFRTRMSVGNKNNTKLCLLHVGPTAWPGKNWPIDRFAALATWLVENGWHVGLVGKQGKPKEIQDALDFTDTTPNQLPALIETAQLFIGIDSYPMHVAQAVGCPTIGLFGVTSSRYIMTSGSKHIGIDADTKIPCAGSRHRIVGQTSVSCSPDCINSITLDQVKSAVKQLAM